MLAKVESLAVNGVEGFLVQIEVDLHYGMPCFDIVGLPDVAVKEARERVRAAIKNSQLNFFDHRITVNLAPANIKKEGSGFDLPIAIGILAAQGDLCPDRIPEAAFLGELALDGNIRPINGVLPMAIAARDQKKKYLIIPAQNYGEASVISGITPVPVDSLQQAKEFLDQCRIPEPLSIRSGVREHPEYREDIDLADVRGQEQAKRALEVAAAGGHNILMIGPPGSGKTMLAKRLPGILPSVTENESIEITKIYSISGQLPAGWSLIRNRPFRAPHHTTSSAGLIGGGRIPKPGEVSLAHYGVLFLDELPEFPREVLEVLRQPLEDGKVSIARAATTLSFPAQFMLAAAMNPCPCGYFGDPFKACSCAPFQIQRYQSRISGPLLDRFDLQVEVPRLTDYEFDTVPKSESSKTIRERVERARRIQQARFHETGTMYNAGMNSKELVKHCQIPPEGKELLKRAVERFSLSARAYTRILKLARTIADLEEKPAIEVTHLAEAIQYRSLDRKLV